MRLVERAGHTFHASIGASPCVCSCTMITAASFCRSDGAQQQRLYMCMPSTGLTAVILRAHAKLASGILWLCWTRAGVVLSVIFQFWNCIEITTIVYGSSTLATVSITILPLVKRYLMTLLSRTPLTLAIGRQFGDLITLNLVWNIFIYQTHERYVGTGIPKTQKRIRYARFDACCVGVIMRTERMDGWGGTTRRIRRRLVKSPQIGVRRCVAFECACNFQTYT